MGITPISSLTPLEDVRSIQSELEPQPLARVESSARTGDETYSPSQGSASGEDDAPEGERLEEVFTSPASEDEPEAAPAPPAEDTSGQINFFA